MALINNRIAIETVFLENTPRKQREAFTKANWYQGGW